MKSSLLNPKSVGCWLFSILLALAYHSHSQWDWLHLPLFNDEFYYATPQVLGLGIFHWPEYSFGHPPGWHLINWFFYTFLGYSPELARSIGLFFSSLTLVILSYWTLRKTNTFLSVAVCLCTLGNEYFYIYSAHNQPLLTTSLFGFLSLILLHQRNILAFFYLVTFSILLRESSLVFLPAAFVLFPNKKFLRMLLLPILILAGFYLWSVLALGDSPFNPQMTVVMRSGQSMFVFDWQHFVRYFQILFFENLLLFPYLVGAGALVFLRKGLKGSWDSLALAFLIVFLLDSGFFLLYRDQDVRNTLVSSFALILFSVISLSDQRWLPKQSIFSPLFLILALLVFLVPRPMSSQKQDQIAVSEVIRSVSPPLVTAKHLNPKIDIVTTNPITQYLRHSYMGMVTVDIPVRWHGGSTGATKIGAPEILVIPTKGFNNFAIRELLAFVQSDSRYKKVNSSKSLDQRIEIETYFRDDFLSKFKEEN